MCLIEIENKKDKNVFVIDLVSSFYLDVYDFFQLVPCNLTAHSYIYTQFNSNSLNRKCVGIDGSNTLNVAFKS